MRPELPQLSPRDEHNARLEALVRAPGRVNPTPAARYDLVVLGGGTAGLVTAAGAAGLGARVALVEKELLGGDCLNVGCVPSKALIACARAAADARRAGAFGVRTGAVDVDFGAVMARMRRLRADLSEHDAVARFTGLGVDVFLGEGRFVAPRALEVEGATLRFKKACVATGGRPSAPPIPGLAEAGYLTNVTVFSLTSPPARLAVLGGGPIGCELAQAFARLGVQVTVLEAAPRLLPRDHPDAAPLVAAALREDGVEVLTGARVSAVSRRGQATVLTVEGEGGAREVEADALLVAVGRAPNVEGLGLEAAGVRFDPRRGVEVDDFLRTSNRHVYAAGDVCSPFKFTHAADAQARLVLRNALFFGRARASALTVPWCTYTDPEVAHVGLAAEDARAAGLDVATFRVELAQVDRARLEGATGFVEVVADRRSGRLRGATVVGRHAGDLIGEASLALRLRASLGDLSATIHPYPTLAEAFRKAGDAWMRTRLTPFRRRLLRGVIALRR
ncbi:MAG: mercuric reductase [Planctomycetes bacterium]|nr:mercuric reductase [Planctomycetota bacterium]